MKLMRLGTLLGCLALVPTVQALDSAGRLVTVGFLDTDKQNLHDTLFSASRYTSGGLIDTLWGDAGITTLPSLRHGIAMNAVFRPDAGGNPDGVLAVGCAINPVHGKPQALAVQFSAGGAVETIFWLQDPSSGPAERSIATDVILSTDDNTFYICGTVITNESRYQGFLATMDTSSVLTDTIVGPLDVKTNALTQVFNNAVPENRIWMVGKRIVNGTPRPFAMNRDGTETFLGDISGELLDVISERIVFSRTQNSSQVRSPGDIVYAVGRHTNKGLLLSLDNNGELRPFFGNNGYVIEEIGNKQTSFNAIKSHRSATGCPGSLIICGTARSLQSRMFVANYDLSGTRRTNFGTNGIKTIFEGPNVQTIARDLLLPLTANGCASSGIFAIGSAESPNTINSPANIKHQTPLIAKLANITGTLETAYGDKGVSSLATEENTAMTVLKESIAPSLVAPGTARLFNLLEGNPFAVSLNSASGIFTLQPGRYFIDAEAPAFDIDSHQLALANLTVTGVDSIGDAIWNGSGILTKALLKSQLFLSEPNDFALVHLFSGTGPNASFGQSAGFSGLPNRFAQMNIQQL